MFNEFKKVQWVQKIQVGVEDFQPLPTSKTSKTSPTSKTFSSYFSHLNPMALSLRQN
jgi:hypothetical protein